MYRPPASTRWIVPRAAARRLSPLHGRRASSARGRAAADGQPAQRLCGVHRSARFMPRLPTRRDRRIRPPSSCRRARARPETMLALNANQRFERLLVVVPTDALREQIAGKFETFGVLKQQKCLDETAAFPLVMRLSHIPTSQAEVDEIFDSANVIVTTMQIAGRAEAPVQERIAARALSALCRQAHHIGARTWEVLPRALRRARATNPSDPVHRYAVSRGRRPGRWRVHLPPAKRRSRRAISKPIR